MSDHAHIVHLAIYPTWADWEPSYLVSRINSPLWQRRPGSFQVRTVASSLEPVTSMGGLRVLPDVTFAELSPADSAMLVMPGGDLWAADQHSATDEPVRAARAFLEAGVPVAAICGATAGLARAGLLDHPGLITAGPTEAVEFARAALEQLGVFDPQTLDAWYQAFAHQDPSGLAAMADA